MKREKQQKGFTLLEILLVIAAIGILAAIVLIAINPNKQIEAARTAQRRSDLNNISKAIQQFIIDPVNGGVYPGGLAGMAGMSVNGSKVVCKTGTEQVGGPTDCTGFADLRALVPIYMAGIPAPNTGDYIVTRTANGVSASYDSSNIWSIEGSIEPTLDLNFARDKQLTNAVTGTNPITFTRGSIGTYVGSDGLIKTAAVNEARFAHDPITKESLGLLVEEQRTNSIRNNTILGAVVGTPGNIPTNWNQGCSGGGSLARQIIGTGLENGINYVDMRISGTVPNTAFPECTVEFESNNAIAAAQTQIWTATAYAKIVAGSLTGVSGGELFIIGVNSGLTISEAQSSSFSYSLSAGDLINNRVRQTYTMVGATTAYTYPRIDINLIANAAVDFTIRIGMPQLERGAFPTSVIPTSGAAVTRNADDATITGPNFTGIGVSPNTGTLFSQGVFPFSYNSGNPSPYFGIDNNSATNELLTRTTIAHTAFAGNATINSAALASITGTAVGSIAAGQLGSMALGYSTGNSRTATNGVLGALSNTVFSGGVLDTARIGSSISYPPVQYMNGTIKRVMYWNTRLADNVLQSLTQ